MRTKRARLDGVRFPIGSVDLFFQGLREQADDPEGHGLTEEEAEDLAHLLAGVRRNSITCDAPRLHGLARLLDGEIESEREVLEGLNGHNADPELSKAIRSNIKRLNALHDKVWAELVKTWRAEAQGKGVT